jgi:hypothetical protein
MEMKLLMSSQGGEGQGLFCSQVCWTGTSLGDLKAEYKQKDQMLAY